jgi:N-methylhydantoinase A
MPLGGEIELDADRAEAVMEGLADEADLDDEIEAARGVYQVANATMTGAIRGVTVERGHDPREFALVAFGGAGPMHAARLADRLDVSTVVVPPANGVLSALGLLAADERHDAVRTYRRALADVEEDAVEGIFEELTAAVEADATDSDRATVSRSVDCRYAGQSFELEVDLDGAVDSEGTVDSDTAFDPEAVRERFHAVHERARGYRLDDPVDLVNLRVTATVPAERPDLDYRPHGDPLLTERDVFFESGFYRAPLYDRRRLPVEASVEGPAIFAGGESTVVVPPEWTARATDRGALVLEVAR